MDSDPILRRLSRDLDPPSGAKDRVKSAILRAIEAPEALLALRKELSPRPDARATVWASILAALEPKTASGWLQALRGWLAPSADRQSALRGVVLARLGERPAPGYHWVFKWTLSFAAFALIVRASPLLFLAPYTSASSHVTISLTRGTAQIALDGWLQDVTEPVPLERAAELSTADGEARVSLHAYGVARLAPHTVIVVNDVSDRPEAVPTIILKNGTIWVQGLLTPAVQPLSVGTHRGTVRVHQGSVSVSDSDGAVVVDVWDRRATIVSGAASRTLVRGDRLVLTESGDTEARIPSDQEDADWTTQNLGRDAVHRREIAQWQRERRDARAGILPTSPLYPVKRVAEAVDLLLTFGEEARTEKKLQVAETRLNEAAALLAGDSSSGATAGDYAKQIQLVASGSQAGVELASASGASPLVRILLSEYKEAVLAVASGSSRAADTGVTLVVRREIAESVIDLASALPGDDSYVLKQTVLETGAALPSDIVEVGDVGETVLLDTLALLRQTVARGDVLTVAATLDQLAPALVSLEAESGRFTPETRQEARSLLTSLATAVVEREAEQGDVNDGVLKDIAGYLPKPALPAPAPVAPAPVVPMLTDEEVDALAQAIFNRIFVYSLPRPRWNQLQHEFRQIDGHPDQGRILRRLYHVLPENGLARYVRTEIQNLREQRRDGGCDGPCGG